MGLPLTFTVLQQSGIWVNEPGHIDPDILGPRMIQNKVRWCASLIQEGLGELRQEEYVGARWWDRLTNGRRILKLGWINDTHGAGEDVIAFCRLTSELVTRYRLDGVIFDLEKSWEGKMDNPFPESRWGRFLAEWRRLRPGLLTVLSTYGYPPYVAFPWKNIAAAKIRYSPQCWLNYAEFYRPRYSLQGAAQVGYPKSYVHFMLVREEGQSLLEGIRYAEEARREFRGQGQGVSMYLTETGQPDEQDAAWALMRYAADSGLSGWNG